MSNEAMIWAGALGGSALGLLGGAVGTYFSIRNTSGPRERAFVARAAAACWAGIVAFLAAMWLTPQPYQSLWWLPYSALLPVAIRRWNKRQGWIRKEEAAGRAA